jgi:hypothetical protein
MGQLALLGVTMNWNCSSDSRHKKCIENFDGVISREATIWKEFGE